MAYRSINPYLMEIVSEHPDIDDGALDDVISKSEHADRTDWGVREVVSRAEVLRRAADVIDSDVDQRARTITMALASSSTASL